MSIDAPGVATAVGSPPHSAQGDASATPPSLTALVDQAAALLRLALTLDPLDEPAAALVEVPAVLERITRATDALRAGVLPAVEAGGLWSLGGHRSFTTWVAATTNTYRGRAERDIRRGRALRDHLPGMKDALTRGTIGIDHVDAATRHVLGSAQKDEGLAHPTIGEPFLVRTAEETTPAGFAQVARSWAAQVDPEAEERAWREKTSQEHVDLARTLDGWHLDGWLGHESGTLLRTALDAVIGRPAADDTRTRGQRDASALQALARHALDAGTHGQARRIRPHLLVHVPVATLAAMGMRSGAAGIDPAGNRAPLDNPQFDTVPTGTPSLDSPPLESPPGDRATDISAGSSAHIPAGPAPRSVTGVEPATFADGTPLATSQLARLLCDANLTRIVLGPESEVLDVGHAKRIHTAAQTKAVITRDKHCRFPGCTAPPTWCEVHHALPWSEGGRTDVGNAILLCWSHHHELHRLRLSIEVTPGQWVFRRSNGRILGVTSRPGSPPPPAPPPAPAPPPTWTDTPLME